MAWQSFIEDGWMRDGIKLGVADLDGPFARYVMFNDVTIKEVPRSEGAALEGEYAPLYLPEGAARALLDTLLKHFRMTRADENLRVDYLAERARVDKLIDAMITPVAMPSMRAV